MKLPASIQKVVEVLSELPSIGPRQAIRLAFYLVARGENYINALSHNIASLKKVKVCEHCFFVHENSGPLCEICASSARDGRIVMVLEKETDLISIENTGKYKGHYFILGPVPKTGLLEEWQKLRLQQLKSVIKKAYGQADEIILGFNPTAAGDFHASLLTKEISPLAKKISRL